MQSNSARTTDATDAGFATLGEIHSFSQDTCTITAGLLDRLLDMASQWPDADKAWPLLADLPEPDQLIPVGAPVLTIFACQPMAATALQTLILRSQRIDEVLAATR